MNFIIKFKKWILGAIALPVAMAGGIDGLKYEGDVLPTKDVVVASETIKQEQKGNEVEVTMPWKGEVGLTVKYDMGEPDLSEKFKDERKTQVITEKVPFETSEGFKIDILLNEKPETNRFCYTIEGWENYDFFYQPPLTQEEIDQGDERPPEIVGSYAIYHKSLANNQYQTGKFGHIPFPYVWEVGHEDQKKRAENLTYKDGQLCVVVQQEFLDNATYPVRVDPTFGYGACGATPREVGGNRIDGSQFNLPVTGTMQSMSICTFYALGNVRMAIYDSASPTNYKAETSGVAEGAGVFVTANTTANPTLPAGDYWLFGNDDTDLYVTYDSGGTDGYGGGLTYGNSWPSTVTPSFVNTRKISIYATYTTSASSPHILIKGKTIIGGGTGSVRIK